MPYRIFRRTQITSDTEPPVLTEAFLEAGIVVEQSDRKKIRGLMQVNVIPRGFGLTGGWVVEADVVPIYGQTERKVGLVLDGNQETRDACNRFAKQLDALPQPADQEKQSFMIGVLQCESLDGEKVFYAAASGNFGLPIALESCAEAAGCVLAPNIKAGHSRNASGRIVDNLVQPGSRTSNPPNATKQGLGYNGGDWDTNRDENKPEVCCAQKLIQIAIKDQATMRNMWEQWYDRNHGPKHGKAIESCPTCKINLPRLLDHDA